VTGDFSDCYKNYNNYSFFRLIPEWFDRPSDEYFHT